MLPLIDVYRTARQLIKSYDQYATEYAHDNAIDCLAVDDLEGYMAWQRVLNALETGFLVQPSNSYRVH